MCVGLGMLPLSFDHVDALNTLNVYASSMMAVYLHVWLCLDTKLSKGSKWKSIQNFWTGGVKRENSSPSQFKWCTLNGSADLVSSFFRWQKGQPGNLGGQQNCLHLRILKNISSLVISDRNCSSKFAFACQVRQ